MEKAYDRRFKGVMSTESDRTLWISLLTNCFTQFSIVFIVIDAFDECSNDERSKLIRDLQQLPVPKARLFMTGRTHMLDTRNLHKNNRMRNWLQEAKVLEISATQEDVEMYLRQELERRGEGCRKDLSDCIMNAISASAHGQ